MVGDVDGGVLTKLAGLYFRYAQDLVGLGGQMGGQVL
jgi:hypothetical protein